MIIKKFSKSTKKHIRNEKARIRRKGLALQEETSLINDLYLKVR